MEIKYTPLTPEKAKELKLKFFLKSGNQPPREVTLEEYMEAAPKIIKDADNNVPRLFMDGKQIGYIGGIEEYNILINYME